MFSEVVVSEKNSRVPMISNVAGTEVVDSGKAGLSWLIEDLDSFRISS